MHLQSLKYGDLLVTQCPHKAYSFADELTPADKPISTQKFNICVFKGLKPDFHYLVTNLISHFFQSYFFPKIYTISSLVMNLSLRCLFICFLLQNPVNPHLTQILLNVTLLLLPRVLVLIPTAVAIIAIEVQNTMTLLIQASGGQIFHGDNRTPSHDNCSCY